jgi:enoyl-CoA hydratase/3-hydroxyacyl-CoA dehydrogenase
VNQVVPDHELFDTSLAWARKLAGQAPLAIERIKRVSAHGNLSKGLAQEGKAFGRVFESADAREGIEAFLSRRQPRFKGE